MVRVESLRRRETDQEVKKSGEQKRWREESSGER
jgi:hypothetical protein